MKIRPLMAGTAFLALLTMTGCGQGNNAANDPANAAGNAAGNTVNATGNVLGNTANAVGNTLGGNNTNTAGGATNNTP